MKKIMSLLLVLVLVFGLVACGGNTAPAATEAPATNAATEAPVEMTAEEKAAAEAEIRFALGLLLDRNYIVEDVSQSGELPASTFVPMGLTDADGSQFYLNAGSSEEFDGYYSVAPEDFEDNYAKAYEILTKYYDVDENGKLTNFPTLTYLYNTNEGHKAIGEYIQSAFASMGINMQMENQEWNTFLNTRKDGNYSIARNGWLGDYNDPISFLDMWITSSGNNDIQYGKGDHASLAVYDLDLTEYGYDVKVENGTWAETYDVLIGLVKTCTDPETRFALMHVAEDMLMDTGAIIPIYYYTDPFMLDETVEGFFANPLGRKYFWKTTVNGDGTSLPVCIGSEPDTMDPALNSANDSGTMLLHLFAGLSKWDEDENGNSIIVADCAEELVEGVTNEDGTVTYTYTLKDGLKWSDGQPLTAGDFEFAWKRAASSELAADYGYLFDIVKGYPDNLAVTAIDDKTLEVTLNNYVAYWDEMLAFTTYMPVREDIVADESWATNASTYVSNGAYTMTGWEHDSLITMTKNEHYWNAENVTMNEVKLYLSDDDNNQLTNWKNDTWLLVDSVPTNEIPAIKAEYTGRTDKPDEYVVGSQIGTYYVCWNVNEPLLPEA